VENPFRNIHIEDVSKATRNLIREKYRTQTILFIIGLIVWLLLGITLQVPFNFLLAVPAVIGFGLYSYLYLQALEAFMEQFARANSFTFSKEGNMTLLESKIFTRGHSQKMSNVVGGLFEDHPFQLFTFRYKTGSGKHQKIYTSSVFELDFQKAIPHIILNAKKFSAWSVDTSGLISLTLEGDFHKYFDLYVPNDLEIEALEILTPDVMHEMITQAKKYSIEFIDDKIYIYYGKQISKADELREMYTLAHMMSERMRLFLAKKKDQWFYTQSDLKQTT